MTLQKSLYQSEQKNKYGFFKLMSMTCLFLYICSLYILSYDAAYNTICNFLFLATLGCTLIDFLLEKNTFRLDYTFFSLLLFVTYAAVTTFWTVCDIEVMTTVVTLVQLFGLYIIIRLNIQDEKDLRNVIYSIYIGAVIMCIYTIAFYGPVKIFMTIISGDRIGSEINQMNGMGLYCTILFIITLHFIVFEKKKWAYIVLPISIFVLLGAGSRKSFLLIAVALFMFAMLKSRKGRWVRIFFILALLGVAIYFVMELAPTNKFFYRISQLFSLIGEDEVSDVSLTTRSNMIDYGLELFFQKPIQGHGPMQFEYFYNLAYGARRAPHSTYIQVLVGFGTIGAFLFYGIYVHVISKVVSMIKKQKRYAIMIMTLLIVFLVNDIGGNMLTHKFIYMFMGIYAAYIHMNIDDEKKVSLE